MLQRVRCRLLEESSQEVVYQVKFMKTTYRKSYPREEGGQEMLAQQALTEVAQAEGFLLTRSTPVGGAGCYEVFLEPLPSAS